VDIIREESKFYGAINSNQLVATSMYITFSGVNTQCEISRNFLYGSGETEDLSSKCWWHQSIKLTKLTETNLTDDRNNKRYRNES